MKKEIKTKKKVNDANYKLKVVLAALSQKQYVRLLCYLLSINFMFGIVTYLFFRNIDRKFAKKSLYISLAVLIILICIIILKIIYYKVI